MLTVRIIAIVCVLVINHWGHVCIIIPITRMALPLGVTEKISDMSVTYFVKK